MESDGLRLIEICNLDFNRFLGELYHQGTRFPIEIVVLLNVFEQVVDVRIAFRELLWNSVAADCVCVLQIGG